MKVRVTSGRWSRDPLRHQPAIVPRRGGLVLMSLVMTSLGLALPAAAARAHEYSDQEARKFFNTAGCNACHGVDEIRIGPSYRLIAARYAPADRDTVERLSLKVRHGGAGAWGIVPMVSNPRVSMQDAEAAVRWILRQSEQARRTQ